MYSVKILLTYGMPNLTSIEVRGTPEKLTKRISFERLRLG